MHEPGEEYDRDEVGEDEAEDRDTGEAVAERKKKKTGLAARREVLLVYAKMEIEGGHAETTAALVLRPRADRTRTSRARRTETKSSRGC